MTKGILQYSPVYLKWQIDIKAPTSTALVTGIAGNILNSKPSLMHPIILQISSDITK
jgi:hypothetical protein